MKILFIACYSPLINNSASIETLQYLNNLAKFDENEIHLLTVNFPPDSIYYDEYIFSMLDPKINTHIISGGKIFEKIMPKKRNNSLNNTINKRKNGIKGLLRKIKRLFAIPDMYLYWAIKASKYGVELMKNENFDVMFSMHEPPSSHICAYRIKKKFKFLKWIAYWSDPWLKDSTRENSSFIRRKIEGRYERQIINLADKHIFVTKANRDDYLQTYNLKIENTFIITRGYDAKVYDDIKNNETPSLIEKDKINIVYAGEIFSKLRDIRPFISAVKKIKEENRSLYEKFNILFFGNIDNEDVKNELIQIENVKVSNRIPYKKALGYMVNADILLLFGNKNSKQIPAKIYDYFGCLAYILVVLGDENDPIIDVVSNIDKCRVAINDSDNINTAIVELSTKIINGYKSNQIHEYEWENISKRLDSILRED
ncbi:glycosyl transferase group 1 [Clostridium sp. AL.422]|uniref:glycosyl transferase group 1 n=1 Tax=Clostridium TaxID=1485 RepID=UPI00293DD92F|nr:MULTISPECIES: glycosyl transferase group 1 [unclassified Clostridium]MDV4150656.1 glycosyl transferase group 1 [Clostridium sp. AL.422]